MNDHSADLSALSYNDYLRRLRDVDTGHLQGKPLRVAVLRSYTAEPLEPVLKLRLIAEGFAPVFWFGGFNQYVQEVLDPTSPLHQFKPDLVLMLTRIEEGLQGFCDDFGAREPSAWQAAASSKAEELAALAKSMVNGLNAQVIVQNMCAPPRPYFGAFDAQRPDSQSQIVAGFNRVLISDLSDTAGAFVWDFDGFVRTKGLEQLTDAKSWYVSKNPFKQSAYALIGHDLMRYVSSALGRIKKCVVVDLDNSLWGGVVGEDGFDGIQLGHSYPGNCYRDFQRELLKLRDRGLLLAINSKNNEEDALRVIDEHPDMVLRREHFAAVRVNWLDKAQNLRTIAEELNIGLESLIFLDDNPVECELVQREVPECVVVQLPEKPFLLPAIVLRLPGIENVRLTDEDRRKASMYRAQAVRKESEARYTNLDDFLKSLDIEVRIEPASEFSVPRIAQLTQKTNQMNMTTRRYTDAQVRQRAGEANGAVYAVAARDKFGDEGIIGVMMLEFQGPACVIDTFLLSCRVIGRGIEDFMASFIETVAKEQRAEVLVGEFIETPKNRPARGFYERIGFIKVSDSRFELDLSKSALRCPAHIRVLTPTPQDQSA